MKKYLLSALALPLLFACSSEDFLDQKDVSNDQFAGIDKVDASFFMDEGATTRMATKWALEDGDEYGLAWLQDGLSSPILTLDGKAYQNHPLTQTKGIFQPATSIYTGKYYLYRPYDETTVEPQAINFNSLKKQPLADGYASSTDAWKGVAKSAIIIADKWTEVTKAGTDIDGDGEMWNVAGTKPKFKIYAAFFSNQTGLDLTYEKNNVSFTAKKNIKGATDIDYDIAAGTKVGAADIYSGTVALDGAASSFKYAPTSEPSSTHVEGGVFWADKKDIATTYGFDFSAGTDPITLEAADENGVPTEGKTTGWFWFNSLPVTAGSGTTSTTIQTILNTSYGKVTVNSTVGDCAYAFEQFTAGTGSKDWIKLGTADDATAKTWNLAGSHNTFINQYGNHKGKFALTADFSTGVMNGMHIQNDAQLQKLLKYYIAAGKTETGAILNLDGDANKEFKISKISIALLQTIGGKVKVQGCVLADHNAPETDGVKIIVTQDGQADLGLADKKEVPALNNVFAVPTRVYLAAKNSNGADITWTWGGDYDGDEVAEFDQALPIDANVRSVRNLGTITVNATNLELSINTQAIYNEAGATMNITKVTTAKSSLINYGTINVGSTSNTDAQLRAYGREIKNDATDAKDLTKRGTINNYGVIGTSDGTAGQVNNYGEINVMNDAAITLLKSNELGVPAFASPFGDGKKMGSVVIPSPFALVSVSNDAENGFIKYTWPAATTTYATPTGGVVKYNTIIVSNDIAFTKDEAEIQYIEFNGTRTQVVNPSAADDDPGYLDNLKGIIVNDGKSIIIEKTNGIVIPTTGSAFLGAGATVYKGGRFIYPATAPTKNYFGPWTPADQVVVW